MKLITLSILFGLILICSSLSSSKDKRQCHRYDFGKSCFSVAVTRVVSGNIIEVSVNNRDNMKNKTVHLFGIQTPPLHIKEGLEAKEQLNKLLYNKRRLNLKIISENNTSNELIGILYSRKIDINKKMLINGYAWCFKPMQCPKGYYKATMRSVKMKKGFWRKAKNNESKKPNKFDKGLKKNESEVIILRIIDGDTVHTRPVNFADGRDVIRLAGIDAPEMRQEYGVESRNKLIEIIDNLKTKTIKLRIKEKDIYGRLLGYLISGNIDINKEMVESGYAWCYKYPKCPKSYYELMNVARKQKIGLFVQTNPLPPWEWRKKFNKPKSK